MSSSSDDDGDDEEAWKPGKDRSTDFFFLSRSSFSVFAVAFAGERDRMRGGFEGFAHDKILAVTVSKSTNRRYIDIVVS